MLHVSQSELIFGGEIIGTQETVAERFFSVLKKAEGSMYDRSWSDLKVVDDDTKNKYVSVCNMMVLYLRRD